MPQCYYNRIELWGPSLGECNEVVAEMAGKLLTDAFGEIQKPRGFCAFTVCVQRYNALSRNSSRIPLVNNFRFAQNAAWIDELTCSEMLNTVCNIYNLTNQCYELIDEITFDFVAQELEGYLKQIKQDATEIHDVLNSDKNAPWGKVSEERRKSDQ